MTDLPRWIRLPVATLLCGSLAACTVGPDFKPPAPPEEKGYLPDSLVPQTVSADVLGGEAQRFVANLDIPQDWWSVYRSRPLDEEVVTETAHGVDAIVDEYVTLPLPLEWQKAIDLINRLFKLLAPSGALVDW